MITKTKKQTNTSKVKGPTMSVVNMVIKGDMKKNVIKNGSPKPEEITAKVKFGSVTFTIKKPPVSLVNKNIQTGQVALARAKASIMKPGVKISVSKNVPLFYADPNQPGHLIRQLNGKVQSGKFVDGKFKAA